MNAQRSSALFEAIKFPHDLKVISHPAVPLPGGPDRPAGGARILIAEDDPVSCEILATRLNKLGYEPVIARDGNEAMTVMRSADAPVLAIIDWMMPGMDGLEVCRRLREVDKLVYIIFLTALGAKEKMFEALDAGADDYLVKPFHPLELQGRIRVGFRIVGLQKELSGKVAELAMTVAASKDARIHLSVPL